MKRYLLLFTLIIATTIAQAQCWKSISGSYHVMAMKSDNSLWGWGQGMNGRMGTGDTLRHLQITHIGTATDWKTISAGNFHTLALKADGTLWACGANFWGVLGDGTYTDAGPWCR